MITCVFNFKAMPFNHYQKSAASGRRYTTKKGVDYVYQIDQTLELHRPEISCMMDDFDPNTRMFKAALYIFQSQFFTASGSVHRRAGDVDAYQKIIFDRFFRFIGHDDHLLKKFFVEKSTAKTDFFILKVGHFEFKK